MRIAVLSGKGGAGKTTISVGLALTAPRPVCLVDADAEQPNTGLYLNPTVSVVKEVKVKVPEVDKSRCQGSGKCIDACLFNALLSIGGSPVLMPELCRSCGACVLACPHMAITERDHTVGDVSIGQLGDIDWVEGRLRVRETMAPTVIREAKKTATRGRMVVIDCPPGAACPAATAVDGVDLAVVVVEPTPFGIHDANASIQMLRVLQVPIAVLVNRARPSDREAIGTIEGWAPLLAVLEEDPAIMDAHARGQNPYDVLPHYLKKMKTIWSGINEVALCRR